MASEGGVGRRWLVLLVGWSQSMPEHLLARCHFLAREGTRTLRSIRSSAGRGNGNSPYLHPWRPSRLTTAGPPSRNHIAQDPADAEFLGKPEPVYECLVLGYVVGGGEVDLQCVLELVAFGGGEGEPAPRPVRILEPSKCIR